MLIKRGLLLLFVEAILLSYVAVAVDISSCQSLSADTVYSLTTDVHANTDSHCFTVSADNVTLNCNGHTIFGNESTTAGYKYGVYLTADDFTIMNCNFQNWSASSNGPAWITGTALNSVWRNITVKTDSGKLWVHTGANNTLMENITFEGSSYLYLYDSSGNIGNITIRNITGRIKSSGDGPTGLTIDTWTLSGDGDGSVFGTNVVINNLLRQEHSAVMQIFVNNAIIRNSRFLDNTQDIYFGTDKVANLTFDNVTFINNSDLNSFAIMYGDGPIGLTIKNSTFINNTHPVKVYVSSGTAMDNLTIQDSVFINSGISVGGTGNGRGVNALIENNNLRECSLTIRKFNNTIMRNNFVVNASLGTTGSDGNLNYNVSFYNNTAYNSTWGSSYDHAFIIDYTVGFEIYNNTGVDDEYCISVRRSANGSVYNNSCTESAAGLSTMSHGIMIGNLGTPSVHDNDNISVFDNYVEGASYGYLIEWHTRNSRFYNNTMHGGIFYDLHNNYNNVVYDNILNGTLKLLNNITNDTYYRNTLFSDLILEGTGEFGGYTGSYNNTFKDMNFTGNLILNHSSIGNVFVNVTWDGTEYVSSTEGNVSSYYRKWYYRAYVNYTNGSVGLGFNVTIYNSTNGYVTNLTTGSDGYTSIYEILDYFYNGTTKTYYSLYNVTAVKAGFVLQSSTYNATSERNVLSDVFTFDSTAPIIALISPVNGASSTSTSTTFTFNVTDDSVTNCSLILDGVIVNFNSSVNTTGEANTFVNATAVGSHTWSVNCTDINNNVGNSTLRSFTISEETTTTTTTSGGGTSLINVPQADFKKGVEKVLYPGWRVSFEISSTEDGDVKKEQHILKVISVKRNYTTIEIRSEPIRVDIYVGEEKKFDLNNDSYYDLYLKLNSIKYNHINLTIKEINEAVFKTDTGQEEREEEEVIEEEADVELTWLEKKEIIIASVLVLVAVISAVTFLVIRRRKRKKYRGY